MYPSQYPTCKVPKRNLTNCTNLESFPFDSSSNIFRVSLYPFESNKKNLIFRSQPAITCSKLTIETLEQGVKYKGGNKNKNKLKSAKRFRNNHRQCSYLLSVEP